MLSIGPFSIVSAITAECSECCAVVYDSTVPVGDSSLPLEGTFSGGQAAYCCCTSRLLLGGYSSTTAFFSAEVIACFSVCVGFTLLCELWW